MRNDRVGVVVELRSIEDKPQMLQAKNVFIDTSIIIEQNFDYGGPALKALADLAVSGVAHLVTTPITISEVEAHIKQEVQEARVATTRFKHRSILKNLADPALSPLLGKDDVLANAEERLIGQLHDFLTKTKTEVIPLISASAAEVFKKYFGKEPPFAESREAAEERQSAEQEAGKKKSKPKNRKSEFPDAFVISALENWCKQKGEKLYVVSTDSDFTEHCRHFRESTNLLPLSRPGEFVHEFRMLDSDLSAAEASVNENVAPIEAAVAREFKNLGFYLEDQEGDVDDVRVTGVRFQDKLTLLAEIAMVATFEVTAEVDFVAEVWWEDMDTAVTDMDGEVHAMNTIQTELERTVEMLITVDVQLHADSKFAGVVGVRFPGENESVPITAVRHDYN